MQQDHAGVEAIAPTDEGRDMHMIQAYHKQMEGTGNCPVAFRD